MAHALAGLVQEALGDHLVVGEQRSVKEDERGAADGIGERRIDLSAARNVEKRLTGGFFRDLEADGVAVAAAEALLVGGVLEEEGDLAGDGEGFDRQA